MGRVVIEFEVPDADERKFVNMFRSGPFNRFVRNDVAKWLRIWKRATERRYWIDSDRYVGNQTDDITARVVRVTDG